MEEQSLLVTFQVSEDSLAPCLCRTCRPLEISTSLEGLTVEERSPLGHWRDRKPAVATRPSYACGPWAPYQPRFINLLRSDQPVESCCIHVATMMAARETTYSMVWCGRSCVARIDLDFSDKTRYSKHCNSTETKPRILVTSWLPEIVQRSFLLVHIFSLVFLLPPTRTARLMIPPLFPPNLSRLFRTSHED